MNEHPSQLLAVGTYTKLQVAIMDWLPHTEFGAHVAAFNVIQRSTIGDVDKDRTLTTSQLAGVMADAAILALQHAEITTGWRWQQEELRKLIDEDERTLHG